MTATPLDGVGWVILEGGKMTGTICIHLGDELEFVAKRANAPKTKSESGVNEGMYWQQPVRSADGRVLAAPEG